MDDIHSFEPILGSWYVEKELGKGSYGTVYLARKEEYGNTFFSAIKHISIRDTDDLSAEQQAKALSREININYQLRGETHFVSFEDSAFLNKPDGNGVDVFIRMECLTPLTQYMKEHRLNQSEIIRLGIDICEALSGLERRGIIHRDIKPANIFVSDSGAYKLGDFGVARSLGGTTSGMTVAGTFNFMAPEIYRGGAVNLTADIYSLGLLLYRLLNADRGPFLPLPPASPSYEDANGALSRRMNGESLPAPAFASPKLSEAVLRACAFEPELRWQSARRFSDALQACLESDQEAATTQNEISELDETVSALRGDSSGRSYKVSHSNGKTGKRLSGKPLFPLLGVAVVVVAVAGVALSSMWPENEDTSEMNSSLKRGDGVEETLQITETVALDSVTAEQYEEPPQITDSIGSSVTEETQKWDYAELAAQDGIMLRTLVPADLIPSWLHSYHVDSLHTDVWFPYSSPVTKGDWAVRLEAEMIPQIGESTQWELEKRAKTRIENELDWDGFVLDYSRWEETINGADWTVCRGIKTNGSRENAMQALIHVDHPRGIAFYITYEYVFLDSATREVAEELREYETIMHNSVDIVYDS